MSDSILDTTKKKLGLAPGYDVFDLDIVNHINGTFMTLNQLGIGPAAGFAIEDEEAQWNTFLSPGIALNAVKSYVFFKVKLAFDPPPTSFHLQALEKQIQELEWRLSVMRDELLAVVPPVEVVTNPTAPTAPTPTPLPTPTGPISVDVDGGEAIVK